MLSVSGILEFRNPPGRRECWIVVVAKFNIVLTGTCAVPQLRESQDSQVFQVYAELLLQDKVALSRGEWININKSPR